MMICIAYISVETSRYSLAVVEQGDCNQLPNLVDNPVEKVYKDHE